jgi:carbon-monoxide dehydrogenase small subunit
MLAAQAHGASVQTIEGLSDSGEVADLQAAFRDRNALQCGYCTPGMLVTARDIVQRLPDADEGRIRVELAGNLCRCTGYAGIVRAIQRVLADGAPAAQPASAPLPVLPALPTLPPTFAIETPRGPEIVQTLRLALPLADVWRAIRDPYLVAECIPGARVIEVVDDRLRGEVRASLGPIETLFSGEGRISFDDAAQRAEIVGDGRDGRTGTRLSARGVVRLKALDAATTGATVTIDYTLRGPLAQFARGAVVQEFAAAIASDFAARLEARLTGKSLPEQRHLPAGALVLRAVWRRLRALLLRLIRLHRSG